MVLIYPPDGTDIYVWRDGKFEGSVGVENCKIELQRDFLFTCWDTFEYITLTVGSCITQNNVFNVFFEAERFAAILLARGTHGLSREFVSGALNIVRPERPKFEAKAASVKGSLGIEEQWAPSSPARGSAERRNFPQRGSIETEPQPQMHFGRTKSPENAQIVRSIASLSWEI